MSEYKTFGYATSLPKKEIPHFSSEFETRFFYSNESEGHRQRTLKKWAEILKENGEERICSSHVIIASTQKMEAKTDS
jgi:uncharacterized sporulation protein YeaH/YhbH (DUF444 family)